MLYLKKLRTIVYEDELKQQQISLNVHLVGPARGTSHRIIPAQLLNRRRISSSSKYISSDLQEELLTGSCQCSYWTDRGSRLHPNTSRRTCKRNFSQDHANAVTEQTEDLILIHIHLVRPARGTSHRIMSAQLLNRRRISSLSTYISSDLQEELLTGSCQRSYWTDGGSHLNSHTSRQTCKRNFSQDHVSPVTEQTENLVFIHIHLVGPARGTSHRIMSAKLLDRRRISSSSTYISLDLQEELLTGSCQSSYWTDRGSHLHPNTSHRTCKRNFSQDHASQVTEQTEDLIFIHIQGMDSRKTFKVLWIMTLDNVHWCN